MVHLFLLSLSNAEVLRPLLIHTNKQNNSSRVYQRQCRSLSGPLLIYKEIISV